MQFIHDHPILANGRALNSATRGALVGLSKAKDSTGPSWSLVLSMRSTIEEGCITGGSANHNELIAEKPGNQLGDLRIQGQESCAPEPIG